LRSLALNIHIISPSTATSAQLFHRIDKEADDIVIGDGEEWILPLPNSSTTSSSTFCTSWAIRPIDASVPSPSAHGTRHSAQGYLEHYPLALYPPSIGDDEPTGAEAIEPKTGYHLEWAGRLRCATRSNRAGAGRPYQRCNLAAIETVEIASDNTAVSPHPLLLRQLLPLR
jgi:hypothetical protein